MIFSLLVAFENELLLDGEAIPGVAKLLVGGTSAVDLILLKGPALLLGGLGAGGRARVAPSSPTIVGCRRTDDGGRARGATVVPEP